MKGDQNGLRPQKPMLSCIYSRIHAIRIPISHQKPEVSSRGLNFQPFIVNGASRCERYILDMSIKVAENFGDKWAQSWSLGVRTCRKKYMLTNSYFCHSYHIYRRHLAITAGLENVPDSQSSAYRRKYYHLFKQKVLSAHIRKKHMFLVNIWNPERTYKICVVKTTSKMLDWC